jgi:hypothetical protein
MMIQQNYYKAPPSNNYFSDEHGEMELNVSVSGRDALTERRPN